MNFSSRPSRVSFAPILVSLAAAATDAWPPPRPMPGRRRDRCLDRARMSGAVIARRIRAPGVKAARSNGREIVAMREPKHCDAADRCRDSF